MAAGKKTVPIIVIAVLIIISAIYFAGRKQPPKGYVESAGTIEATEVNLAPKTAGTIEWMCCREGEPIKAGQPALRLDARQLTARLDEARAALKGAAEAIEEAKVELDSARARKEASRHEAQAASSEVKREAALVKEAGENLKRSEALFKDGFITKKDLDAARASYDSRRAELDAANARGKAAQANLRNSEIAIRAAGARIASLEAQRERASAQVDVIKAELEDTVVESPISGVVAYMAFEPSEFVNPGETVYTIYDTINIWARADLEETDIRKIRLGSPAEVTSPGSAEAFRGKVKEIGEVGGFATQRDVTRGRPDIKTFRVKVAMEDPRGVFKPGMTVNLKIFTEEAG